MYVFVEICNIGVNAICEIVVYQKKKTTCILKASGILIIKSGCVVLDAAAIHSEWWESNSSFSQVFFSVLVASVWLLSLIDCFLYGICPDQFKRKNKYAIVYRPGIRIQNDCAAKC